MALLIVELDKRIGNAKEWRDTFGQRKSLGQLSLHLRPDRQHGEVGLCVGAGQTAQQKFPSWRTESGRFRSLTKKNHSRFRAELSGSESE